jgi:hypothetical protein
MSLPTVSSGIRPRSSPRSASISIVTIVSALTTLAAVPSSSSAQGIGQAITGLQAGASFETYRFGDADAVGIESVTLITLPFGAGARLGSNVGVSVRGAWARGSMQLAGGGDSSIDGLTDTEVRATYTAGNDRVTFSAVALLPTGRDRLTGAEIDVAGVVAADVLPFRISNWGSGGGFGGSVAFAAPVGAFGAGLSAGYVLTRDFEPVEITPTYVYRPGNQLHVTAALDRSIGSTGKFGLRASFLSYDADRIDDVNLYSAGNRIEATASYAFATGSRSSAIVWAGVHHRGEGAQEDPATSITVAPASDIIYGGTAIRIPFGRGVIQPGVDVRLVSGSDDVSRGYIATAGASAELPAGSVTIAPTVRGRFGSVESADAPSSGVAGADIGLVIRFGGR